MPEAKKTTLNCFKEYDVRGKLGYEFNESIAYRIGRSVSTSKGCDCCDRL